MKHWINNYIGIPYERGNEGTDAFDCWSFVRYIQHAHYGRDIPAMEIPCEKPSLYARQWRLLDEPKDGCGVLMTQAGVPHVGIYLDIKGGVVAHCTSTTGVVVDDMASLSRRGLDQRKYYGFIG